MTRRLTQEEVEAKANEIHNNKYTYRKYTNSRTKWEIHCPEHGWFEQYPRIHIKQKSGCPECAEENQGLTQQEFEEKAMIIHGDKFIYGQYNGMREEMDICCPNHGWFRQAAFNHLRQKAGGCPECSLVVNTYTQKEAVEKAMLIHGEYEYGEYLGTHSKWAIRCQIHGRFYQIANKHFSGAKCPKCRIEQSRYTQEEAVKKAQSVHGFRYQYGEYPGSAKKWDIYCEIHGWFKQLSSSHFTGKGCKKCAKTGPKIRSQEDAVIDAGKIHQGKYTYGEYINANARWEITCPVHGIFYQRAATHLQGHGCPSCSRIGSSKGAQKTENVLKKYGINFSKEYRITIQNGRKFFLDFLIEIEETYIAIEYDGKQHYEPIGFFGGQEAFESLQERDALKNAWCAENNIPLIRVPYTVAHDEIEDFLIEKIKEVL